MPGKNTLIVFLILVGLLLILLSASVSVAADPGDGDEDVAPCCRDTGIGFSLLDIVMFIGGIIALVVIMYLIFERKVMKKQLDRDELEPRNKVRDQYDKNKYR